MIDDLENGARQRYSCNGILIENRVWPIEWHHYRRPCVIVYDLQGHFCCLKLRRLTAENFCPSATVVCVHDGALGGVIRGVINNTGDSRRWLITDTAGPVDVNKIGCAGVC